ncbi:NAD(P)/FAD-dependent oxidoreductase [Nitratifractor salsuginis]|uniref:FAD dependent oxidoreductase n=1 Tax=Nitratifractor salsuginis (strain DSM 16511 / JCM 12458 / E9I37-1) TaxID=749222 RepID=E6X026_NITSE|nr:FAD-dependent oxidoreductase [Nitratifractor salsuginis]ADV46749.1 FAD dependent oxidoreductase [Nitratifractor salsuginis DSM 16511]
MICVIGAGIAGIMAAYFLREAGEEVLLIDRSDVPASGGSGAAGAFISPKIGKGGPLQELTNEAFAFAHFFYRERFAEHFHGDGVLRIPKNPEDEERFKLYEPFNYRPYERWDHAKAEAVGLHNVPGGFYFPEAGDADAPELCRAVVRELRLEQMDVEALEYREGLWHIISAARKIKAEHVVLATGYESELLDLRYMGIKGLWGSRGDYATRREFPISLHKDFSLSSTRRGRIKLGATHVKHPNPCMACDGRPLASLEAKAAQITDTSDFRLIETFCGMRSTSRDHFPLVGPVVDVPAMLAEYPAITRGAKAPLRYLPNLSIFNGLGGRGFVFAPLMAKRLAEHITTGTPLDPRIHPDRLFWKWVRRIERYTQRA